MVVRQARHFKLEGSLSTRRLQLLGDNIDDRIYTLKADTEAFVVRTEFPEDMSVEYVISEYESLDGVDNVEVVSYDEANRF